MRRDAAFVAVDATKDHRGENFPVASLLLSRRLRAPVLAFYGFARAADDIADAPDLAAEDKLARLAALEDALVREDARLPVSFNLAQADRRFGAGAAEARQLLEAFRQDAVKRRYENWRDLLAYCERSANPVGHFLLRLHGEDEAARPAADALCTALQILNHLQDLVPDRERLDRIYLPVPWMERAGGTESFFVPENARARRAVLDAALDRVEVLVQAAEALPARLKSRRLAAESAVTVALARRLTVRLRASDPVVRRVELTGADFARAFTAAPRARGWSDRRIARTIVTRSGSTFRLGMSSLSGERRRAIHAVYAYCRLIDDIADGAAPASEKRRFIEDWRREIYLLPEHPETPVGRELAWSVRRFELPRSELHALLDGMETDSADRVRLPDDAALDLYCRRVAGAVGLLAIRIFGVPEAEAFALGLGRTLQLVNVLRDIDEDASRDRVYVPLSRLSGGEDAPASSLVQQPRFVEACRWLSEEAATGFAQADRALELLDRHRLRPAILMMEGYRRIFELLRTRGWHSRGPRPQLAPADKLRLLWLACGGLR